MPYSFFSSECLVTNTIAPPHLPRMRHGRSGSHRIRRRSSRRRYDDPIALDGRDLQVVDPQIQVGQEGTRTATDHDFVQGNRRL